MNRSAETSLIDVLRRRHKKLTLLLGNGVNRYGSSGRHNSWADLLLEVANRHIPGVGDKLPSGVTATEVFDLSCLAAKSKDSEGLLQKEFCTSMASWRAYPHHERIVEWARERDRPILTTNFDQVLSESCNANIYHHGNSKFTYYYPWATYFGLGEIQRPSSAFGIWHLHGMMRYHRSIRLGLTHYMGAVHQARRWIHRGGDRLFSSAKAIDTWSGSGTWLDAFFHNDLLVIGLSLDEVEVFIRWLLLERSRLFKNFPSLRRRGWFVCTKDGVSPGRELFLRGVGLTPIRVKDYHEIYQSTGWH